MGNAIIAHITGGLTTSETTFAQREWTSEKCCVVMVYLNDPIRIANATSKNSNFETRSTVMTCL
jgi:hypothetical protein